MPSRQAFGTVLVKVGMKPFAANTSAPQPAHHVVSPCTISVRMAASVSSSPAEKKPRTMPGLLQFSGGSFDQQRAASTVNS
jgi:hypothetical protein